MYYGFYLDNILIYNLVFIRLHFISRILWIVHFFMSNLAAFFISFVAAFYNIVIAVAKLIINI